MKRWNKYSQFTKISIVAAILSVLLSCNSFIEPRANQSDRIVAQLSIGMKKDEVSAKLGAPYDVLKLDDLSMIVFAGTEVYPSNLLGKLTRGTEYWRYAFWISSNDGRGVGVFLSQDGHVIGWIKDHSEASRVKYSHERLTEKLRRDMGKKQVTDLLGAPQEILHRQFRRDDIVNIYEDHYWTKNPTEWNEAWEVWVYHYPIDNNSERRVYIAWNKSGIDGWGYDHSQQEADRYFKERGQ